jgi:hypothetical protein
VQSSPPAIHPELNTSLITIVGDYLLSIPATIADSPPIDWAHLLIGTGIHSNPDCSLPSIDNNKSNAPHFAIPCMTASFTLRAIPRMPAASYPMKATTAQLEPNFSDLIA